MPKRSQKPGKSSPGTPTAEDQGLTYEGTATQAEGERQEVEPKRQAKERLGREAVEEGELDNDPERSTD